MDLFHCQFWYDLDNLVTRVHQVCMIIFQETLSQGLDRASFHMVGRVPFITRKGR